MKEIVVNKFPGFQASMLLKVNFSTFTFQNFLNCSDTPISRNAFLWLLPPYIYIYIFNLFLLSCKRVSKTVGVLRKFPNVFSRTSKLFIRTHLDHRDIIHDQVYNFAFHQKLQSFQYNASLSITGTTRGTSREKLHQELDLESLQLRRWHRELCCFVKI